jgi:hypothetical protein
MRYTYSLNDLYFRKPEMSFEAWLEQNPHLEKGDFDPRNLYDGYAQEHEHQGFVIGGDHIRGLLIADPICIEDMCGRYSDGCPAQYWADWYGWKVVFGGDWMEVPDMPTPDGTVCEPQVRAWVDRHLEKEANGRDDTSNTQDISASGAQGTAVTGD